MATPRVTRGRASEAAVADSMAKRYWPFAKRRPASLPGSDIENVPGLAIEVKARRDFNPKAWVKQAGAQPGLSMVVMRPDGMGEATVTQWPAFMRWGDLLELLHAAGYGSHDANHIQGENGGTR